MDIKLALANANFQEFNNILGKVRTGVSCLGGRYLYFEDYEGTIHIDAAASKTMQLVANLCAHRPRETVFIDEKTRLIGKEIVRKVERIYEMSDELVKRVNCITYLFLYIREVIMGFSCFAKPPREGFSIIRWNWQKAGRGGTGPETRESFNYPSIKYIPGIGHSINDRFEGLRISMPCVYTEGQNAPALVFPFGKKIN